MLQSSVVVCFIHSNHAKLLYKFQVFSAFGTVQKIAIFEKNGGTQALIQYPGMSMEIDHCKL